MANSLVSTNRHINVTATTMVVYRNVEIYPQAVEFALKVLYSAVATLGLLSNGGIIYIFITKKIKMNSFKILLLNLTVGDLLSVVAIWPYNFIDLRSLRGMQDANFMCALTIGTVMYWFASVASIFSLCLLSVNRYLAVCKPQRAESFNKNLVSLIIVCIVWPTSISISIPNIFSFEYKAEYAVCTRKWPEGFNSVGFSVITSIFGYIIPISVITFTFFATRKYLWSRSIGTVSRPSQSVRRNRKTALFMGFLIVAFFVCWSPFFVYWILSRAIPSVFPQGVEGEYSRMKVIRVTVLISLFNTVINPIIYGLRGDAVFKNAFGKFRQEMGCNNQVEDDNKFERNEPDNGQSCSQ